MQNKILFKIDESQGTLLVSYDRGCTWEIVGRVVGEGSTIPGPIGPQGPQGVAGAPGRDGTNGITPYISEETGTWIVNGQDTHIIAAGSNGEIEVEQSDDLAVVGTPSVESRRVGGVTYIKFHQLRGEDGVAPTITASKTDGVVTIFVNGEPKVSVADGKVYQAGQYIDITDDEINCTLVAGDGITINDNGEIIWNNPFPNGNAGDIYYITEDGSNAITPMQLLTYNAFIETDEELEKLKTRSITLDEIYNDWHAFGHIGDSNTSGSAEEQQEKANPKNFWTYNKAAGTMICSKNSLTYLGFVDNKNFVDHYTMQARLSSNDSDNDSISLIIAYYKDANGKEYTLSAVRTGNNNESHTIADYNADGTLRVGAAKPLPLWAIVYNYKQADSRLIATAAITGDTPKSWQNAGTGSVVRIVRNGDTIQCSTSPFNSSAIHQSSLITIDLNSIDILGVFKGKRQYGVGCFSQSKSTFSDITIQLANTIYDMRDGAGWIYTNNTWVEVANKLYNDFEVGRILNSQDFGKSYYIDVVGHNIKINDDSCATYKILSMGNSGSVTAQAFPNFEKICEVVTVIKNISGGTITVTLPTSTSTVTVHNMYGETTMDIPAGKIAEIVATYFSSNEFSFNGGIES